MTAPYNVAFLRAINVGGRRVKMSDLKRCFEEAGFKDVETFIASGNVVFSGGGTDTRKLERKIEKALEKELGFWVDTFVRTSGELSKLSKKKPFPKISEKDRERVQVGFLAKAPPASARSAVKSLTNENDLVTVQGKELFWLPLGGVGRSKVGGAVMEKAVGGPTTVRGTKTIQKLLDKHA